MATSNTPSYASLRPVRLTFLSRSPHYQGLIGQTFYFQAVIEDDQAPNKMLAISNSVTMKIDGPSSVNVIYNEDFENGWGEWRAHGGIWQIGRPGSAEPTPWSGSNCAGTALGGYYPRWHSARLESSNIQLPTIQPGEQIRLNFRQCLLYEYDDYGWIEISPNSGKNWIRANFSNVVSSNWLWTQASVDLSQFAGMTIMIAFVHHADGDQEYWGWYIDDLCIFSGNRISKIRRLGAQESGTGGIAQRPLERW